MFVCKLQDRILFRCRKKNTVACLCYNSAVTQRESDHKPVYAVFDVMLKPGTDTYVQRYDMIPNVYSL